MKLPWLIIAALLVGGVIAFMVMLSGESEAPVGKATEAVGISDQPIRIGLIPERDVFALRKQQQILADYISGQMHRPVELVTGNSYATVLSDFQEKRIDAALLGSLVTVLCVDRMDATVLLKTRSLEGTCTYHGVICVPEDSPIRSVEQLAGQSIAMIRTTTAGDLFPIHEMNRLKLLDGNNPPRIVWAGTHDDALDVMMNGTTAAAAVKNLRLAAWQKAHPGRAVRVLATSGDVPENALVVRGDIADTLGAQIAKVMRDMSSTSEGRAALAQYGAAGFVPCDISEYDAIFDMVEDLDGNWNRLGIDGPAPRMR